MPTTLPYQSRPRNGSSPVRGIPDRNTERLNGGGGISGSTRIKAAGVNGVKGRQVRFEGALRHGVWCAWGRRAWHPYDRSPASTEAVKGV